MKIILAFLLFWGGFAKGQDWARKMLEKSPRHHEWVEIKQKDRTVHSFLVFPEVKEKATAVVVIHENRGLTDWVRSVADQLAAAGFIAIAPDLLSGSAPNGGRTKNFPDEDSAREALYKLPPDQVTSDLQAVASYVGKLPAANGKVAVAGFCWGGAQTFRFATEDKNMKAAFVFYGTGPTNEAQLQKISCPVYGFYGGKDARVNSTIPESKGLMAKLKKTYEPVIYEDAGHGFMRTGEEPEGDAANKIAREEAWKRFVSLLKKL